MTGAAPTVDTVVFDIGNVLVAWDPHIVFRQVFPEPGRAEWFLTEVCSYAWNLEQDRGRPWPEAEAEAIARHPDLADAIRAYRRRWAEMVPREIAANVAVLNRLQAAGVPLYAITNFAADTFVEARRRFPFLDVFRDIVISAEERLLKPDPRIYAALFARNPIRPGQTVFIDDSPANVAAAREIGMQAIHYTPEVDLAARLRDYGLPA